MEARNSLHEDIVEEVERKQSLEPGDFGRAADAFWSFLKYLIISNIFFTIKIYQFGTIKPNYLSVVKAIKKEIRRRNSVVFSKDRLYRYLLLRRKLLKAGLGPKMYYLKKKAINGRTEDERRRAKDSIEVLQSRCNGLKQAAKQRKASERRARRELVE